MAWAAREMDLRTNSGRRVAGEAPRGWAEERESEPMRKEELAARGCDVVASDEGGRMRIRKYPSPETTGMWMKSVSSGR